MKGANTKVVILLQHVNISNQQVACLKRTVVVHVRFISIKYKRVKRCPKQWKVITLF